MGSFFGIFAIMLLTGVPIALALGVGGVAYLFFSGNGMLILALPQRMMAGVDQFILLTIPLFVLAGMLMNVGGVTDRVVVFARSLIGHRPGGMSSVTVLASGFFAGIAGSATAEASALGSILIPSMAKQGVPKAYAAALVGVSAIMGGIIPPSITIIIYGVLSGTSIGQLFMAGILPGVLLAVGLLIYASWRARREGFPTTPKTSWADRGRATVRTLPALFLPLIILVGIRAGIFTATEAAAVAVAYAMLVGFAYRDLTFDRVWGAFVASAVVSSAILFINAMVVGTPSSVNTKATMLAIASAVLSVSENPYIILLMLNLVLIVLGMFLEPISILILTMPILLQFQALIGMDPVQFGVMVILNAVIGMATPPVGILLFIVCAVSGEPLVKVAKEALPLIGICLLVLVLVALVPPISLFLSTTMM